MRRLRATAAPTVRITARGWTCPRVMPCPASRRSSRSTTTPASTSTNNECSETRATPSKRVRSMLTAPGGARNPVWSVTTAIPVGMRDPQHRREGALVGRADRRPAAVHEDVALADRERDFLRKAALAGRVSRGPARERSPQGLEPELAGVDHALGIERALQRGKRRIPPGRCSRLNAAPQHADAVVMGDRAAGPVDRLRPSRQIAS